MIKKISVSKVVEFNRKSEKAKQTFITNLKNSKPKESLGEGGDYWIHSLSTIAKVFLSENKETLDDRIIELSGKREASKAKISKDMFQRNVEIVQNFREVDIPSFKPRNAFKRIPKTDSKSVLKIQDIPVQVIPHHLFTFEENNTKKLGAIWFVAKIKGYKKEELGIFSEALHHYLKVNYSDKFIISPEYCISMDVISVNLINYSQLLNQEVPSLLNKSLEAIQKLL